MRTALFVGLWAVALVATPGTPGYRLVHEIQIGGPGGWDYITIDPQAKRLYVSHATKIVVADAESGKVVGEIPDTAGVHGFAIAADLGRGFSTNGRENTSTIVDLKTLKALGKVETGGNPDAVLYEPDRKEIYTFNGSGKSATVIDAKAGKVVATVDLAGKPEAAVSDAAAHRVFVNIEDTSAIKSIDTSSHTVVATWPLSGCEEPTGLAYDASHHRLFSACHNKTMVVTDSTNGRNITTIAIGARVDGAAFDPQTGYVFSSNGEGTVTIATVDDAGKATVLQTLTTQPSARTIALDPATHRIYLPAATMTPAQGPGGRPQMAPESFKVLVYGPGAL
jgi:DNA-binding beta-propeller fold protein YncE